MYLPRKVFGLPKASRVGHNTSKKARYHLYVVNIKNESYSYKYYKVHVKRNDKSKIKYFKTKLQAELFLESLRLNPYI